MILCTCDAVMCLLEYKSPLSRFPVEDEKSVNVSEPRHCEDEDIINIQLSALFDLACYNFTKILPILKMNYSLLQFTQQQTSQ